MIFDPERFTAVKSIYDINTRQMRARGVRIFCFDIENTLGPMGLTSLRTRVYRHLCGIQDEGFGICFGTNALNPHLRQLGEAFHRRKPDDMVPVVMQPTDSGLPFGIGKAPKKPQREFFDEMRRRLQNPPPATVAMVGDKFRADVLGAINAGMHGILVNPIGPDLRKEWLVGMRKKDEQLIATYGIKRAT